LGKGKLVKTLKFKEPKYIGDSINAIKIFNEMEIDDNAREVIINLVDKDSPLSGIEFKLIQEVCENG